MDSTINTIGIGLITSIIISCSYYFLNNKSKSTKEQPEQQKQNSKNNTNTTSIGSKMTISDTALNKSTPPVSSPEAVAVTSKPVNDVWEERRQRGIAAASLHIKKDVQKETKPFGSSYYYAHNSTKTIGGYKDGLTMEDFTMNGPRLLSRNGTPVVDESNPSTVQQENDIPTTDKSQQLSSSSSSVEETGRQQQKNATTTNRIIQLTKYLWDDPGNTKDGLATIRIDTVPTYHTNSSSGINSSDGTISWKEIRPYIQNITASIAPSNGKDNNNGLNVKIEVFIPSNDNNNNNGNKMNDINIDYIIKISKLYGRVQKVEYKNKEKRLLIQLYKYSTLLDKSNLKAWPYPQQQLIK